MKRIRNVALLMVLGLTVTGPLAVLSGTAVAQQEQMKDDLEQFAMDLHVGMQRANLTEQQREQIRKDLENLRKAHQNHDRIEGFRAIRNFRSILDSGAFQPQDQQRIKQDLEQIREAREERSGQM